MNLTFTPLHPVIGAECTGVDIGVPITPAQAGGIHAAMDQYAVLVFRRDKPLTTEQQLAFTAALGEMEKPYTKINSDVGARLDDHRLSDISNLSLPIKYLSARTASACINSATGCGIATAATSASPRVTRRCRRM